MAEDAEPSLFEYARFYGLTADHFDIDPLASVSIADQILDTFEDEQNLPDNEHLGICDTHLHETLQLGKDEAHLLRSVTDASLQNSGCDSGIELKPHRARDMKVETPILTTDHESDMQTFGCPIMPDLTNEHLPLESLDEEGDEGLTWPSAYEELPGIYLQTLWKEALEVSTEALIQLHAALKPDDLTEAYGTFEGSSSKHVRHTPGELVEVPLMPMSPIVEPYEPSSDTGHLELLSEMSSPTAAELAKVDHGTFGEDTIVKQRNDLEAIAREAEAILPVSEEVGDIYSPLRGIEDPPSSPPLRKPRMRDAKVEVPLTPPQTVQPPPWKRKHVSFSETLHEVIPELPSPLPKPEDLSSDDIDKLFAESIAPIAVKAEREIEQEQLQEADTMHRVKVPIMDFSLPIAPWKASSLCLESANGEYPHFQYLSELKSNHFFKHKWPSGGADELSLQWMPFPAALGRVETYEVITDNGLTDDFIRRPECVDCNALIWKPEGLRIFDDLEASDEEELEYGTFPDEKDIVSLVRKRRLELEALDNLESRKLEDDMLYCPLNKPVNHEAFRKVPKLSPHQPSTPKTKKTSLYQGGQTQPAASSFSAMASLEGFMGLRNKGTVNSESTARRYFHSEAPRLPSKTAVPKDNDAEPPAVKPPSLPARSVKFMTPTFTEPKSGTPFIASTSFLSKRTLAKRIRELYPAAEIIERDFSLHSKGFGNRVKKRDEAVHSSDTMADEADIILSPSTGLILTTLRRIKQRSLPGQSAHSAIRDRIRRAAPRYERLLIVVSHESSQAFDHLGDEDGEAIADFTAFCSSVQEECRIIMVPEMEEDIAQWVVALMAKYGLHESHIRLLQGETLWEVFLRRAGMNAFAAQAILGELKPPENGASGSNARSHALGRFGLSAFIKMSLRERLTRFKPILGGDGVLTRVSTVLDSRW